MILRAAAALALAVALATATTGAAHADPIATATSPPDDVRRTILIGPSGQVWEPDGQGAWLRTAAGGVAADVQGALVVDTLVIAGKATPLYHLDAGGWYGLRLGERGKTVVGTGPAPAVAIGKQLFVWTHGAWKRVATADRPVVALWAASERKLFVATDRAVLRLAGSKLVSHDPVPVATFAGPTALGLTADGVVRDVAARAALAPRVDGQPVLAERATAAADGTPWILGRLGSDRVLVRRTRAGWERRPDPPLATDDVVVHLAVDAGGRAILVTAAGDVQLADADGTWTRGTLTTRIPAGKPGPGPARMP